MTYGGMVDEFSERGVSDYTQSSKLYRACQFYSESEEPTKGFKQRKSTV